MRLDTLPGRRCSIAGALDVVGDRWALLLVRKVSLGNHRFSDILRGTGAPACSSGGSTPRRRHGAGYHLTEAGRDLVPVLQALLQWGDRWVADSPPVALHHHGHRITASRVCDTCGEPATGPGVTRVASGTHSP